MITTLYYFGHQIDEDLRDMPSGAGYRLQIGNLVKVYEEDVETLLGREDGRGNLVFSLKAERSKAQKKSDKQAEDAAEEALEVKQAKAAADEALEAKRARTAVEEALETKQAADRALQAKQAKAAADEALDEKEAGYNGKSRKN